MKTIRTVLSLLLIIISSFCLAQQKKATFTITDSFGIVKQFAVDDAFLDKFTSFSRNEVPQQYRVWMSDIYKALKRGESIEYNQDTNTIRGMSGMWHVKDESSLSANTSTFKKWIGAQVNSEAHQFRDAIVYLKYLARY